MYDRLYGRARSVCALTLGALWFSAVAAAGDAQQSRRVVPYEPPQNVPTQPHEVPVPEPPWERREPEIESAAAAQPVVRDRFTSIQVNLGPFGGNVVEDAANEPSIAVDPTDPNRMAIGWRQFGNVASNFRQAGIAYTNDGGFTWSGPFVRVLDPGQFRSDPVLVSDRNGVFYYSSLSSLTSVEVFTSFDGGVTWPRVTSAYGGDKQWLAVDNTSGWGDGHLYQLWNVQFSCCVGADFTRSVDGGASFEPPIEMPTVAGNPFARPKWGTIDVGLDGAVYVVGASLDQRTHVFVRSGNAKDATVTPRFDFARTIDLGGVTAFACGPNPEGLLGQVWVASDHSWSATRGNIYVLASVEPVGSDPLDVHLIRSEDGGQTWSNPIRINDDPTGWDAFQWFGTMGVAPNGRIDVVWNDTRNAADPASPDLSELYYSYSLDGGYTWSANEPVSPPFDHTLGYPRQNKIGDYDHLVSDDGGANVAYAATFNGEQDIYYVRATPDCNGNGLPDETDVADGVSADCNGNLTPDECEPDEDCNLNGLRDICETAGDTTVDCNRNATPDECEIADGTVVDDDGNGVPDVCECEVLDVTHEVPAVARTRYVALTPRNAGIKTAIKLTLWESAAFPEAVGASWWVGDPQVITDSVTAGTEVTVAALGCTPVYRDWGDIDLLYVFGDAVVPDATYEVRVVRAACPVGDPASFSTPEYISTGAWGDVVEPKASGPAAGQPDFHDVAAIVQKFIDAPGAESLPDVDLYPAVPDQVIDFQDVAADVAAFLQGGYPFGGPTICEDFRLKGPEHLQQLQR